MFGTVRENDENKSSPLPVTWFNSKTPILHKKDVRIEKKKTFSRFCTNTPFECMYLLSYYHENLLFCQHDHSDNLTNFIVKLKLQPRLT